MKRILTIFSLVFFISLMISCNSSYGSIYSGTKLGDSATWPGCVEISLDHKIYDLDEEIQIHYSYGHAYLDSNYADNIVYHYFVIYLIDGNQISNNPEDGIVLLDLRIDGDDLLSDKYLCDPGLTIFNKVDYNASYDLLVNFSEYDIEYGLVFIRFYETYISEDNIEGEIVSTERTCYNETFIYFLKGESEIEFSEGSFA